MHFHIVNKAHPHNQITKQNITCTQGNTSPPPEVIILKINSLFNSVKTSSAKQMMSSNRPQSKRYLQKLGEEEFKKPAHNRVMGISHPLDLMKFILKSSFLIIQHETDTK